VPCEIGYELNSWKVSVRNRNQAQKAIDTRLNPTSSAITVTSGVRLVSDRYPEAGLIRTWKKANAPTSSSAAQSRRFQRYRDSPGRNRIAVQAGRLRRFDERSGQWVGGVSRGRRHEDDEEQGGDDEGRDRPGART
jgi:hypothetical protein